jgi:hypothetical protein
MSRVPMAEQCRVQKPQEQHDTKIIHCQRAINHPGQHSAGKFYRWTSEYRREKKA